MILLDTVEHLKLLKIKNFIIVKNFLYNESSVSEIFKDRDLLFIVIKEEYSIIDSLTNPNAEYFVCGRNIVLNKKKFPILLQVIRLNNDDNLIYLSHTFAGKNSDITLIKNFNNGKSGAIIIIDDNFKSLLIKFEINSSQKIRNYLKILSDSKLFENARDLGTGLEYDELKPAVDVIFSDKKKIFHSLLNNDNCDDL
jgi:hypothetical protein